MLSSALHILFKGTSKTILKGLLHIPRLMKEFKVRSIYRKQKYKFVYFAYYHNIYAQSPRYTFELPDTATAICQHFLLIKISTKRNETMTILLCN